MKRLSRLERKKYFIRYILNSSNKDRKRIINNCDNEELMAVCDLLPNLICCRDKLAPNCKKKLQKVKSKAKKLLTPIKPNVRKRILQSGGMLSALLTPLTMAATSFLFRKILESNFN